jgi:site-specific DNA recombinase
VRSDVCRNRNGETRASGEPLAGRVAPSDRIRAMHVDTLDGIVAAAFYGTMSNPWREGQNGRVTRNSALKAKNLARTGGCSTISLNCSWEDGEVVATFRLPFNLFADTTAIAATRKATVTTYSAYPQIWLPRLDSNQRPSD